MIKFCLFSFIISRIFYSSVILITYGFFMQKYEVTGELLEIDENHPMTNFEQIVLYFLKHFYSYDSVHFIHIAKNNYTTDFNYAFFPLFPLIIRYFTIILQFVFKLLANILPLFKIHNIDTFYLLGGFLVSNIFCLINTLILYKLAYYLTNSNSKSKLISFLFLINPGTIFFMTIYSENLFLCLHLLMILMLLVNQYTYKIYSFAIFIILVMTTRSTSIFLCAYFIIPIINNIILQEGKKYQSENVLQNLGKLINTMKNNIPLLGKIFLLIAHSFICFLWMTKFKPTNDICFSLSLNYKNNVNYFEDYDKILEEMKNICYSPKDEAKQNIYTFLQNKYWDVGFLSQYKFEKLDRIILATPMNILAIFMIITILKYFNFYNLLKLKFDKFFSPNTELKISENKINQNHNHEHLHEHDNLKINRKELIYNLFIFTSFVNFLINFIVVIFIAHPQINNRVYATCPILYFYCADEIYKFTILKNTYWKGLLILIFFVLFSILGCVMHTGSYGFA